MRPPALPALCHNCTSPQAGRRVKSLSKHPNKQVAAAAAEVVAAWKEVVRKEVDSGAASGAAAASLATSSKAGSTLPRAASQSTVGQADEQGSQPASQQTAAGGGGSSGAPPAAAAAPLDLSGLARTGDSIRDKCRQNLAQVGLVQGALARANGVHQHVLVLWPSLHRSLHQG